jgi:hypothetical protein
VSDPRGSRTASVLDTVAIATASTLQLLAWIAERPRGYAETMDAWKTSCPRLSIWEDAVGDGLVRVARREVVLTDAGRSLLGGAGTSRPTPPV